MAKDYFSKRDKSLGITWAKLHQYIFLNSNLHLSCVPLKTRKAFIEKMYNYFLIILSAVFVEIVVSSFQLP